MKNNLNPIVSRWSEKESRILSVYYKDGEPRLRQKTTRDGYVYLLYNPYTNLYKIGCSSDFKKRFLSLQTAAGAHLKSIIVLETNEDDESIYSIESFLHNYFLDKRKLGEWFNLNKADCDEIIELFWQIEGTAIYDEDMPFCYLSSKSQPPSYIQLG